MDLLESQTDQISFNSAVDSIIIFPSCTFKYIKKTFRIEFDQRVIKEWSKSDQRVMTRFHDDEGADAHDITQRLQAQFAQDAYALRMV
jgi:hypothetical protein